MEEEKKEVNSSIQGENPQEHQVIERKEQDSEENGPQERRRTMSPQFTDHPRGDIDNLPTSLEVENLATLLSMHSMQSLLEQAMNLKILLETLVTNEETRRSLPEAHQQSFQQIISALNRTIDRIQANTTADPAEIADQLLELRMILQGNQQNQQALLNHYVNTLQQRPLWKTVLIKVLTWLQSFLRVAIPIFQSDEMAYVMISLFSFGMLYGAYQAFPDRVKQSVPRMIDFLSSTPLAQYPLMVLNPIMTTV